MKKKYIIDKEYLLQAIKNNKTIKNITDELECSKSTIYRELKFYNLSFNKINPESYVGKRHNDLLVIEFVGSGKNKGNLLKCLCNCGIITIIPLSRFNEPSTKSCGCSHKRRGNNNPLFKGYGEITGKYWGSIKKHAENRNIKFEIDLQYAWNVFLQQNRCCKLTKIPLIMLKTPDKKQTASLDRIDSKKGYIEGNIQWVHKYINLMKLDFSQDEFISLCKHVSNNNYIETIIDF